MSADTQDLGSLAGDGLNDVNEYEQGTSQEALPDTETTKVSFKGVSYDPLTEDENYRIGDEVAFIVRGRVVEVGDRQLRDRGQQHFAKVDVSSVIPHE